MNEYGYFYWDNGEVSIHEKSNAKIVKEHSMGSVIRAYDINDIVKVDFRNYKLTFYKNDEMVKSLSENDIVKNVSYFPCLSFKNCKVTVKFEVRFV